MVDAGLLVAALLVTWAAVDIAKEYFDRPRPPGSHVATRGPGYPSGHAAFAVAWLACAVTRARLAPITGRRIATVAVAVVLMAAIAVSRVFLRAHYLVGRHRRARAGRHDLRPRGHRHGGRQPPA